MAQMTPQSASQPQQPHKKLRLFVQPFQERPTERVDQDGTEHQLIEQTAEEKFLQMVKKIDFSKKRERSDTAQAPALSAAVQDHPWVSSLRWLNAAQIEVESLLHMLTMLETGGILAPARVPRVPLSTSAAHRVLVARVAHKRRALLSAATRLSEAATAGRRYAEEDLGLVLDVAQLARKWPVRLTRPPLRSLRIAPHDSPVERVPPSAADQRLRAAAAVTLPVGSLQPVICPCPAPPAPAAAAGGQVQAIGHREIDVLLRRAHWTLFTGGLQQALQDEAAGAGSDAQVVRGVVALPPVAPAQPPLLIGAVRKPTSAELLLLAAHTTRPLPRHTLAALQAVRLHENALSQLRAKAHHLAAAVPQLAFRVVHRSAQPRHTAVEFSLLGQLLACVDVRDSQLSIRGSAAERLSAAQVCMHVSCEAARALEQQLAAQAAALQQGAGLSDGVVSFALPSAGPRDITAALSVRFSAPASGLGVDVLAEWEQRADGARQRRRWPLRDVLQMAAAGPRPHVPSLMVALEVAVLRSDT